MSILSSATRRLRQQLLGRASGPVGGLLSFAGTGARRHHDVLGEAINVARRVVLALRVERGHL
mgnify:CR=1 FL=1